MAALLNLDDVVGLHAAAKLAGCSISAMRCWCENGEIPFSWGSAGTRRKVKVCDIIELIESRHGTIPKSLHHLTLQKAPGLFVEAEIRRLTAELSRHVKEKQRRQEAGSWDRSFISVQES